MGTGVNVQERLVALHHLDISWRPSDMEQRNGRGERQGNWAAKTFLGNLINVFYYATERTLDASMYNTVSMKAKFIAQIKTTSDLTVRTIKDVEEDVDMGGMAAELSGDPIFKERATLTKKIVDLERSNRGFLQDRYNLEDRARREETSLAHHARRIGSLEKAIPLLHDIPRDANGDTILKGIVRLMEYTKLGEFGRAILQEAEYAKKYKMMGKPIELGSLWGFKVFGEVSGFSFKEISRYVVTPYGEKIGNDKPMPDGEMAVALQVREMILGMPSELERVKRSIIVSNDNLREYRKQLSSENPYTTALESSRTRLEEINRIIKERNTLDEKPKETETAKPKLEAAMAVEEAKVKMKTH